MMRSGHSQRGFVLLAVIVTITLLAAIVFALNNRTASELEIAGGELQYDQLRYVAEAGMAHAKWQLGKNRTCKSYGDVAKTYFGDDSYSATISPTSSSPVTIIATGTSISGAQKTLIANGVTTFQTESTATVQLGVDPGKDTILDDFYPNANYGGANYLQISSAPGWEQRPVVQFDLTSIPTGVSIISARLELKHWGTGAPGVASVHRMNRDWVEGTRNGGGGSDGASWSTYDGTANWTAAGGDFESDPAATATVTSATHNLWAAWEISTLVADWVSGKSPNFGLLLQGDGTLTGAQFASKDASNVADAPRLVVTYACPCGVSIGSATVTLQPSGSVAKDTLLIPGGKADSNTGSGKQLWVNDDAGVVHHSLLEFDLSTLAAGVVVQSATLDLYSGGADGVGSGAEFGLFRVTREWVEGSGAQTGTSPADGATWNSYDGVNPWTAAGGDYDPLLIDSSPIPDTAAAWHQFDITSLASGWLNGTYPNQGVLVKAVGGSLLKAHIVSGDDPTLEQHPKLTIIYGCPCGSVCTVLGGSGKKVMLVVVNQANLAAQESAKKALIGSWGYTVNVIDQNASQANFDTALAVNDVVYITEEIDAAVLGTKLRAATIGVVNEDEYLEQELGFGESNARQSRDQIEITDNMHSITDGFALGLTTIATSPQTLTYLMNGEAPGQQILGKTLHIGANYKTSLVALEVGAELWGGEFAAGRRVLLPWGDTGFDINALNATGLTIMERSIEWASATGTPVACSADYTPTSIVGAHSTIPYGGRNVKHLAFLPAGTVFNGVTAPVDGAWLLADNSIDIFSMVDMAATVLTTAAIPVTIANGLALVTAGTWQNNIALADQDGVSMQFIDLNAVTQGSFSTAAFTLKPTGVGFIATTQSGTYDEHLLITSELDSIGSVFHGVYIVDQSGALKYTIDVNALGVVAMGVAHLPGTDRFLMMTTNGGVYTLGFDGTQYGYYDASTFGLTKLTTGAINPQTCDHVTLDSDSENLIYLNLATGSGGGGEGVVFEEFTEGALGGASNALIVEKPVGTVTGDLLIAAVAVDGKKTNSLSAPAGWNIINIGEQPVDGGEVTLGVWWKVAGSSEAADYTFTWSANESAYGLVMRFTGHDSVDPINVLAVAGGLSNSPESPAVTTTVPNTMILRLGGFDDDDITVGAPGLPGHTGIAMGKSSNGNGTASVGAGYVMQAAAGDSGTSNFALTRSEEYRTVTIAIAPAP